MKVVFVNLNALGALTRDYPSRVGGEESQHAELSKAFARAGHDVTLLTGDHGQPDEMHIDGVRIIKAKGVNWGFWQALRAADAWGAQSYYYSCAGRLLAVLAVFCWLYKRRLTFRVASDADCDPRLLPRIVRRPWDRWLYQWGLRRVDQILVQTERQQRLLMQHYGIAASVSGPDGMPAWGAPLLHACGSATYTRSAHCSPFQCQPLTPIIAQGEAERFEWPEDGYLRFEIEGDDNGPVPVISHRRWRTETNGWKELE